MSAKSRKDASELAAQLVNFVLGKGCAICRKPILPGQDYFTRLDDDNTILIEHMDCRDQGQPNSSTS